MAEPGTEGSDGHSKDLRSRAVVETLAVDKEHSRPFFNRYGAKGRLENFTDGKGLIEIADRTREYLQFRRLDRSEAAV